MKRYISLFVILAVLANAVSCKKIDLPEPDDQGGNGIIYLWADQPHSDNEKELTKVIYSDGLGISGKEKEGFHMRWEEGDVLYAIQWDDAYDRGDGQKGQATKKYLVLTTTQTEQGGQMLFQGIPYGGLDISKLNGGEHFVLVHGHFVLDDSTDGGVIDFPTSEVTKAGYGNKIHYGGVQSGNDLTFRNQDGTLANLKKHEYMVADAYVRFYSDHDADENVVIEPYLSSEKGGSRNDPDDEPVGVVQMKSAHTLLRLTMFVPNGMFDGIDYRLLGVSLRTNNNDAIFHRYFRLHPNTEGIYGPNGWKEDWNDHDDKEENAYLRENLPGTRRYDEENVPGSSTFDQEKTVCQAGSLNGTDGHYVTLYFSLPSRPLAPDSDLNTPSKLLVSIFTRTHAFRVNKEYSIAAENMKPGKIVNLNVNFAGQCVSTRAITDPDLGITFAPGIVYATRADNADDTPWTYGIYSNQGEYAGLEQQTDVMGDYFLFGSIDPREVFHKHEQNGKWVDCSYWTNRKPMTENLKTVMNADDQATTGTTDVASLAAIDGVNNIFSTMTKKEADRVWKRIQQEGTKGINMGYYYYDASAHDIDDLRHTAHQAKGAWKFLDENDPRRQMSSTIGIWIGIDHQPTLDEQDMYVFLPSSNQLNNSINNMTYYDAQLGNVSDETGYYEDAEHYRYYASKDYGNQHVTCLTSAQYQSLDEGQKNLYVDIPTVRRVNSSTTEVHHYYLKSELTGDSTAIMKFSTNTRERTSNKDCERLQVWYEKGKTSFHSNSGIKPMEQTFGRVVRPVIF